MMRLKQSIAAKAAAIILLAVMFIVCIASCAGMLFLDSHHGYGESYERFQYDLLDSIGTPKTYDALHGFISRRLSAEELSQDAFRVTVLDENGVIIDDALHGQETVWQSDPIPVTIDTHMQQWSRVTVNNNSDNGIIVPPQDDSGETESENYYITGSILADYSQDMYIRDRMLMAQLLYSNRYVLVSAAVIPFIVGVVMFIFLMASAGHRAGVEEIYNGPVEKLPFDVFTVLCLTLFGLFTAALAKVTDAAFSPLMLIFSVLLLLGDGFVLLWFCMSWSMRIKSRSALKSCLCYKLLRRCRLIARRFLAWPAEIFRNLPIMKRSVLIAALILLAEFLWFVNTNDADVRFVGFLFERAVLTTAVLYSILCIQKLRAGTRRIAGGELSYKVDTEKMYGPFKEHGQDLNSITDGMNKAVGERMKSERFRTELITNVSHDIKTPLTSIINYVDLLEREQPENEKMREYIQVLSRQSSRLKKLIDDLLEASKASTGSLSVEMSLCDLCVLMDQCAGEYGDRLAAKQLELVMGKPDSPVTVMADGRHMWRILDNLLNNVCKYAQPGTRVYLSVSENDGTACLTVKNISAMMLNVSGDELMERFVRGDISRSTEGSGLGLNIAQSLTRLQGGDMTVSVDGDLFKVTLLFPASR